MQISKKTLIILSVVAMLATLSVGIAATSVTKTINWTYTPPSKSITVSPAEDTISFGEIIGPTTETRDYDVTNNGNVPCTVTALTTITGGTISLDKTTATLAAGDSTTFTVTVNVTGPGSASIVFSIS